MRLRSARSAKRPTCFAGSDRPSTGKAKDPDRQRGANRSPGVLDMLGESAWPDGQSLWTQKPYVQRAAVENRPNMDIDDTNNITPSSSQGDGSLGGDRGIRGARRRIVTRKIGGAVKSTQAVPQDFRFRARRRVSPCTAVGGKSIAKSLRSVLYRTRLESLRGTARFGAGRACLRDAPVLDRYRRDIGAVQAKLANQTPRTATLSHRRRQQRNG
jgi:hypothetical protein